MKTKKSDSAQKLILEKIIGLTTNNSCGLASNDSTEKCVYIAGCVVVVYGVESNSQSHLMVSSRPPKPLSCVAISPQGGSYIAAGESGSQPAVLVWDYSTQTLLAELKGHRFGVTCIDFSCDGKHLISVGFSHDGYLCLWDWRSERLVTKLKVNTSVSAILSTSFSPDGSYFVTAGKMHLKYWALGSSTGLRTNAGTSLLATDGKPANLGSKKGYSFVSVAFPPSSGSTTVGGDQKTSLCLTYALTDGGILCLLHSGFTLRKSVDLKVDKGFAVSVSNKLVACACSSGTVKLITVETLKSVGALRCSSPKKLQMGTAIDKCSPKLPDAIACQFSSFEKLVVVYGDHTLSVWDVSSAPKIVQSCILASHSACIWDVKNLPCKNMHDPALICVTRGFCHEISFATCSDDGTIRLWDLVLQSNSEKCDAQSEILVNQPFGTSFNSEQMGLLQLVSTAVFEPEIQSSVDAQGFRSMATSSDGKYLAAGDCQGNIHVYNLYSNDYTCFQEAHAAEILSLSFSSPSHKDDSTLEKSENHYLLASGGKDQLIHIYDVQRGFDLIGCLDDHSSAVTSVKLTSSGSKILSCSADGSILFRDVGITDDGFRILHHHHHQIASHGTTYDMAIDPRTEIAVTVGQDKKMNMINISTGKFAKAFKQDPDFGEPIKVAIDPSGCFLVCSYSNKSMAIYDFTTGELVTQAVGHAEVITGVVFLPDCKHIISVGGDSCIFIWKMPALLSSKMWQRTEEHACSLASLHSFESLEGIYHEETGKQNILVKEGGSREASAFKFSVSKLPKWAQTKLSKGFVIGDNEFVSSQNVDDETSASVDTSEFYTPCHFNLGGSDGCHMKQSNSLPFSEACEVNPMDQEIPRFDMEKGWNTIYNVYLDPLESPEVRDRKEVNCPLSTPDLNEDSQDLLLGGASSGKEIESSSDEQYQGDDLFSQHYGNLSTIVKLEGRKSSHRKSFSARFVVRRDCLTGSKRLFDAASENSGAEALHCSDEVLAPPCSSENPSTSSLLELQPSNICDKDMDNLNGSIKPTSVPVQSGLLTTTDKSIIEERDQVHGVLEETNIQEKINECKAAILSLDAAVDKTLQSFAMLGMMVEKGEVPSRPPVELCDLTSKLVPLMQEKMLALNAFTQSNKIPDLGSSSKAPDFEPLIERFAERLSHQVLELVRRNIV